MGLCTKLPTVSSCCCGCTLRTGTLILAWIYVIVSALALIGAGSLIGVLDKKDENYNVMFTSFIILIVVYCLQLLLGIMLLWGTTQNKPNLLLPYLWLQAILLILQLVNVIIAFVGFWGNGIGSLIGWLLGIYFFMVVNSFYQQIKVGG